jgi:hypothetical protein
VYVSTDDPAESENREGWKLGIGVLPPCSSLNVPLAKLREDTQKAFHSKKRPYGLVGLGFRDADGRTWVRLLSGVLMDGSLEDPSNEGAFTWIPAPYEETITWAREKDVEIKTLSECGRAN